MNFWSTFWGGLIITLIGQLILMGLIAFIIKIKKSSLIKMLSASRLFGHGIECVYNEQTDALPDIEKDIDDSAEVKIFCMRGRSYIQKDEDLSFILQKKKKIKFLLSDPNNPYINKRAAEIERSVDSYKKDLQVNLSDLSRYTNELNNINWRLHKEIPVFRLLILDNRVYFSFLEPYNMGSKVKVFRAISSSEVYNGLVRYYDYLWEQSPDMQKNN